MRKCEGQLTVQGERNVSVLQNVNVEHTAASSCYPAVARENRRTWVSMSVLTPGLLGATFRCISPGPCASVMRHEWLLKLANIQKVENGCMEISMQTAFGYVRLIEIPPHTNTCTASLDTVRE